MGTQYLQALELTYQSLSMMGQMAGALGLHPGQVDTLLSFRWSPFPMTLLSQLLVPTTVSCPHLQPPPEPQAAGLSSPVQTPALLVLVCTLELLRLLWSHQPHRVDLDEDEVCFGFCHFPR